MAKWGEGDPRWIVEERPDATNVNNWHWSEKNACQWSQTKIKDLLTAVQVEDKQGTCIISEVNKCDGEAMVNNRKGRLIFFYDWTLEMKWKATCTEKDSKLRAQGKILVPNLSDENSIDEVDVEVSVEENTDFAFAMKTLMHTEGAKLIRVKLSEYLQALKDEFSQGLIKPSKDAVEKKVDKPAAPNNAPVKIVSQSQLAGAVKDLKIDTTSFSVRESLFCPIEEAYKCFVDQKMLEAYTRGPIKLEAKPGGKFEFFNGNISGEFIELEENKRIKQYWRNKTWAAGHRSIVELVFEQTSDSTFITLTHSGIPYSELDATKQGWQTYYWQSIKQTFGFGSFITDVL